MSIRNGVKDSIKHVQGRNIGEKLRKVKLSLQDVIFNKDITVEQSSNSNKNNSEFGEPNAETKTVSSKMNESGKYKESSQRDRK